MTTYLEHETVEGERWDQLALRYYGDATAYEGIIAANTHVLITPTLQGGIRLRIPVIAKAVVSSSKLPPWVKR